MFEGLQYLAMSSGKDKKWKRSVNNNKMFHAFLKDLSKVFCCLDYQLLTAMLKSYTEHNGQN